jgi:hypothetical protein
VTWWGGQSPVGGGEGVVADYLMVERGAQLRDVGATHVLDGSGEGGPGVLSGFDVVIDVLGIPALTLPGQIELQRTVRGCRRSRRVAAGRLRHAADGRLP